MAESPLVRAVDELLGHLKSPKPDPSQLERGLLEVRKLASTVDKALNAAQQESHNLASYYTFEQRLFEHLTQENVLGAVAEMVINFVGSGDFALYARDGQSFLPKHGMGATFERAKTFKLGEGPLGTLA